jgi:hypothetical protein
VLYVSTSFGVGHGPTTSQDLRNCLGIALSQTELCSSSLAIIMSQISPDVIGGRPVLTVPRSVDPVILPGTIKPGKSGNSVLNTAKYGGVPNTGRDHRAGGGCIICINIHKCMWSRYTCNELPPSK